MKFFRLKFFGSKTAILFCVTLVTLIFGIFFQGQILQVEATVQVLLVSHTAIPFGTVFPGEELAENYTVQLDTSAHAVAYATSFAPLPHLKNLCPFLTIASIDAPSEGDSFDYSTLTRSSDNLDRWQVKLNVPGIEGQLAQDHTGGIIVKGGNYGCKITVITRRGEISGHKFKDLNGNGIKDSGEPGLRGWTIKLFGSRRAATVTDGNGNYHFSELLPGIYQVCEIQKIGWTQSLPSSGFTCADGTNGYSITLGLGQILGGKDFGNKKDSVATRTYGFWKTHTQFTSGIFQSKLGGNMPIGSSPHKGNITNNQSAGNSQLFGAFYSSIPKKTNGSNRADIDKARIQLLQQLVAAKLNCAAFSCGTSIQTLVTNADSAYATGTSSQMNTYAYQLNIYNNIGDSLPIPPSLGPVGSATPATSQNYANKVFWDAP